MWTKKPSAVFLLMVILCTGCGNVSQPKGGEGTSLAYANQFRRITDTDWTVFPLRYQSPVDFATVKNEAPEAIGWLDLSCIGLSYPIMYREGDRGFYLHHDIKGNYAYAGSIYVEDYNRSDFTDFVTVIYGHNMKNNTMFGYLEDNYKTEAGFGKGKEFSVYLPDKELRYEVVAAVHHNNRHLLMYRDFTKVSERQWWLQDVLGTTDGRFNPEISVTTADRLVVLATCTYTKEKRYLVVAKLVEEIGIDRRILLTDTFSKRCIHP